jgi:hypothetical protein
MPFWCSDGKEMRIVNGLTKDLQRAGQSPKFRKGRIIAGGRLAAVCAGILHGTYCPEGGGA